MHVDQRPRLLLMLGLLLITVTLLTGYTEIFDAWMRLFSSVQRAYTARHHTDLDLLTYLIDCLGRDTCKASYQAVVPYSAPMLVLFHTNVLMGVVFAGTSRFWRPELWFRRQARVAAARMDDWRERSSVKARGTLQVPRAGRLK
jgi:hypothetical protein